MSAREFILPVLLSLTSSVAFGWGTYGHEQISSKALDLVRDNPAGACLEANRDFLVRLAVTPDLDWKMGSKDFFTLTIDDLAEKFPQDPQNIYYLRKLKNILDKEAKHKKKILSEDVVTGLGRNPSDAGLLAKLRQEEEAAGRLTTVSESALIRKKQIDNVEHSLHFWEADAFTESPRSSLIRSLPSSPDFDGKDLAEYEQRARTNAAYISKVDPCKVATNNPGRDVVQHGTAPWRSYSLLKMGASQLFEAVSRRDSEKFKRALEWLGAMGHYVGDMGQPFHATLNYDGQGTGSDTMGIHSIYEEKILETDAHKVAHSKLGKENKIWSSFDATDGVVDQYARLYLAAQPPAVIPETEIIPTIFKLVADGYDLIAPLLKAFQVARMADPKYVQLDLPFTECKREKGRGGSTPVHAVTWNNFLAAKIPLPGTTVQVSVLESAEKRMGESAAVLARLWLTALKLSHLSPQQLKGFCPKLTFDPELVIMDYPAINFHSPLSDFAKKPESSDVDKGEATDTDMDMDKNSGDGDGDDNGNGSNVSVD